MKLTEMIRLYCLTHNIQQKQLAKDTGILPSTICRFFKDGAIDSDGLAKLIKWALS